MDYTLNEKAHAFERFSRFRDILSGKVMFGAAGGPGFGISNYGGNSNGANDSLASGMDIAISPKLLTDFRLGYYRYNVIDTKHDQGTEFAEHTWHSRHQHWRQLHLRFAGFKIANAAGRRRWTRNGTVYGAGLNINRCNCPLTEREDQFQIVNNWTRIIGNHTIQGWRRSALWPQPARSFGQRSRRPAQLQCRPHRRPAATDARAVLDSPPSCWAT